MLTEETKILQRGLERSFLNSQASQGNEDNLDDEIFLAENETEKKVETPTPSVKEMRITIKKMKNGKAGGENDIVAEFIKYENADVIAEMH